MTTCASVNVIVEPNNTINLTSAVGTNLQSTILTEPIIDITYVTTGATGVTFSGLPAGVMDSWASNTVTISGTPTALGTSNYTINLTGGCGSVNAMGTISVIVGVAQIMGGSGYSTLQEAINAAADGSTIVLLQNVTETNLIINKSVIIDAGNFTLTAAGLAIPAGKYLRWLINNLNIPTGSALSNMGTLWNNGAIIHPDPFANQGIYKGTGSFNGSFTNNGSLLPGN